MKFDLVVLGGGPAGYTGAIRAAKLGMRVALVEKDAVGGTCLNRGCIPTKSLLHSAALYASRSEWAALGVTAANVGFSESAAYAKKDETVSVLRGGVEKLLSACGVHVVKGDGRITGACAVEAAGERIEGERLLIATGSRPARLEVSGADLALDSDAVLASPLPDGDAVIIGGGVIGAEFASYLADTGRKVTVLEYADRILPFFSKEISVQLASALRRKGAEVIASARVTGILRDGVVYEKDGKAARAEGAFVISATGRRPNTVDIGLASIGLAGGRAIPVDACMRTTVPGVYAAGDVTGGIQLAHYASACALKAVAHMAGKEDEIDLSVVPSLVYTDPEIAVVGRVDGGAKSGKFLLGANGKSLVNGSNRGFIKVYCDDKDRILGAELLGSGVTEIVGELSLAISRGMSARDVAGVVHAHPTVYESVAEACEDVFGLATHKR